MAERLIPDSPDYFMSRGWVRYMVERDLERAADDYRKVVELAPSYPEPRYALIWLQIDKGLWVQAMQGLNEVERLDPANPQYAYDLFSTALAGRRYAEAEIALRRAETLGREGVEFDRMLLAFMARGEIPRTALPRETDAARQREFELMCGESLHITRPGNNSVTYTSVQALALSGKGEIAAARALLDSPQIQDYLRKNDSEPKNAAAWANTAVIEALRGNRDEALRRIHLALEIQPESKDSWGGPLMRCNYAMVLTWIGEREKAVDECALRLRTPMPRTINYPWMRFNVYAMRQHPAFAPLCGDPRFGTTGRFCIAGPGCGGGCECFVSGVDLRTGPRLGVAGCGPGLGFAGRLAGGGGVGPVAPLGPCGPVVAGPHGVPDSHQPSAREHVCGPQFAAVGAGPLHPIQWLGPMVGLGLALRRLGLGFGFAVAHAHSEQVSLRVWPRPVRAGMVPT